MNVCVKNLSDKDIEVYREFADGFRDLNKNIAGASMFRGGGFGVRKN